ncbi:MAG: VWA domain-containing protein [Chloroflexota bacterium]|nr:VWA domain-containing protein [Chloroflexia bacterium]MDQ3225077.1 VWA domain-containing protein [Chloroflexota bacterium]
MRLPARSLVVVQRTIVTLLLLALFGSPLALFSAPAASAAPPAQDDAGIRTVNLELILDLSGSMARDIGGGETRMEAAKRVMNDVIDALPEQEGVNVGFRIYGHLGDNTESQRAVSCQSSDLVVPIAGVDKEALRNQVAAAQPIGWTPIALSLERAGGDFQSGEGVRNHILLVTDGEETCGGDPCAVADSLRTGAANLTTHVVGFALTEQQAELVSCIAERGGGLNLRAASARELSNAIFSVLEEIQVIVQNGFLEIEEIGGLFPRAAISFVATGDQSPRDVITLTTDNRVELTVGFYDVSWSYATGGEITIRVNIEAGRTTWVRGSLLKFPQGAGEIYAVTDLAGTVVWQAPFELGDYVWVLPGIYTMELVERVGDPVLVMAQVQTLPGSATQLEVFTAP